MAKKYDKTNKGLKKIDLGRQTPMPRPAQSKPKQSIDVKPKK